jgi:hypothetical protein
MVSEEFDVQGFLQTRLGKDTYSIEHALQPFM